MNGLSLFSGGGIGDLAAHEAGITTVAMCESDEWCRYALERLWPGVPVFEDIRCLHGEGYLDKFVRTWYLPLGSDYTEEELVMAGKLKKLTAFQASECVRMYESGLSLAPIASYFGVSRQAMWDLLRRRTKMRPQKREGEQNCFYRGGVRADTMAHDLLEHAVRKGAIERMNSCESCGATGTFKDGRSKIQAHHDDYNKPMDVRWLCQKCHHDWHKKNAPVRKEVLREVSGPIDIVSGGFP